MPAENYAKFYAFKYIDIRMSACKATMSKTVYPYSKKGATPNITVTNAAGDKLVKDTDYTVTCTGNKKCGKAVAKVTGRGKYTGTIEMSFIVRPSKVKIVSAKSPRKKQVKAVWKKSAGGVTGYQVQVALNKKFTKCKKTYFVKKPAATAKTITKLRSKKTYFVRVRAYKNIGKKRYVGGWSAIKKVKCK